MATRTPPLPINPDPDDGESGGADWRVAVGGDDNELEPELSVVDKFRNALGETPTDKARVRVSRVSDESGAIEFCQDLTLPQFMLPDMLDRLRAQWGAGHYEFMLIGPRGTIRRGRQRVAAPFGPAPVSSQATQPAPQSDALAQAMAVLAQGQAAILDALTRRPDPREEMKAQLEMLAAMRAAFQPVAAPAAPAVDPMAMFSQVVGMIRESKKTIAEFADDEREEKDPLGAAIPKLIDTASALVLQAQKSPAPVAPISLPPSIAEARADNPAEIPQPEVTEGTADMTNPAMLLLRGYVDDLLDLIARNEPPEKGGEYVAENIPEEFDAYLTNRYWFEFLAANFPQLAQHETWVRAAKAHADKLMTEPEEGDAAQG